MTRHLETGAKSESKNPSELPCTKNLGDMRRIRLAFNHHLDKHTCFDSQEFEEPLVHETLMGVGQAEYLIRAGRTLL
jgi:hypothetical protein